MRMFFDGTVYSVGDGFCYEGIIQKDSSQYHFVIDCGSKAPKTKKQRVGELSIQSDCNLRLNNITDNIACENNHIDMFILTHFHEDHYNGYTYLFDKTRIDTIIMPYLYPEERLCLLLNERADGDRSSFLANPYSMILEKAREGNPDVQLILIRGNRNERENIGKNDPFRNEEMRGENHEDLYNINEEMWGENHEDWYNILEIEGLDPSHARVIRAYSEGSKIQNFAWMFKFFNLEADRNDIKMLKKAFGNLTASELYKKITDYSEKKRLRNIYDTIATTQLSRNLNNTSIVAYHAPAYRMGKCGTLITADIDLNHGYADAILKYFEEEWDNVGLFSIPHHGSNRNWNKDFIENHNLDNSICFVSTHNYYSNRMDGMMMSDLRVHNIFVLVVDENDFSEVQQWIEVWDDRDMFHNIIGRRGGIRRRDFFGFELSSW